MRSNYWSCSKFADWLRGTDKLEVGTSKEWQGWRKASKESHPIRYWIAEEALDRIQNTIMWPRDKLYSVKYWINNRFVTKTHAMTSNLPRGQWHEFDQRLLHSMFDEMVNFIEIEQAWFHIAWDKEARKKYKAPFYAWGWFRWRTWRSPEAGLDTLRWAADLTDAEFLPEDKKDQAKPTHQAITARELLELYQWWKVDRPARPDIYDASGWSAICEERRKNYGNDIFLEDRTEDEKEETRKSLDMCNNLEEHYFEEDEQMMIRLIKVRRGMWT